jgi:tungstate transport system ATP-binding protein
VLKNFSGRHQKTCQKILEEAGLYAQRQQPARLLSGGEQQRLALARALATSPQVLFLDEPTASIDPGSTLQIENLLSRVSEAGVKLILVTHDIGQAHRLASDVLFMHQGRILEHTMAEEFFDQPHSEEARAFLHGDLII